MRTKNGVDRSKRKGVRIGITKNMRVNGISKTVGINTMKVRDGRENSQNMKLIKENKSKTSKKLSAISSNAMPGLSMIPTF